MDVVISFNLCPQVKSYVRVHGQPNDDDKGYVSISYNTYVTGLYYKRSDTGAHIYRLSLLCAFIFINILTPVALGKSASLYYPKIVAKFSTGEFMGCLYWATAIMAFLCNILYIVTSFRHHFSQGNPAITSCIIHHDCSIPSERYGCLQRRNCHSGGCGYNHSKCSLHRTITFHLCCEIPLQRSERL